MPSPNEIDMTAAMAARDAAVQEVKDLLTLVARGEIPGDHPSIAAAEAEVLQLRKALRPTTRKFKKDMRSR